MHAYCSYFDSGYLSRGLTLIDSLRRHGDESPVWVLAMDEPAKRYLDQLDEPNLHTLTIDDLEAAEPGLAAVRPGRSRMEYYFTATPLLIRYVMNATAQEGAVVAYLDSDLYFFDDPGLVLDALGDGSVGIIEHRYPKHLASRLAQYGRFNVGWVGFRDDASGRACLDWWAESTVDWCFDRPDAGRYADQGYLDRFPEFAGVVVLGGAGFNLAPWNTARHELAWTSGSRVMADGDPLVFFHFHGLRRVKHRYVTSQLIYGSPLRHILRDHVYKPYLNRLERSTRMVAASLGTAPAAATRGNGWRGKVSRLRKTGVDLLTVLTANAISVKRLNQDQATEKSLREPSKPRSRRPIRR